MIISILILIIFSPIILITFFCCYLETKRPIFVQKRVGKNLKPFYLYKFRTLKVDTPSLSTHLISKNAVTKFGKFIRALKIDELPQLVNVLKGEMSLVGPRPCLYNQEELIYARKKKNVFSVKPGITGLAQIKGIDMSKPDYLSIIDKQMVSNLNLRKYFIYLFLTMFGKGKGDRINLSK